MCTREIRGKLKSRTGQWSVRDFNFLEFCECANSNFNFFQRISKRKNKHNKRKRAPTLPDYSLGEVEERDIALKLKIKDLKN